MAGVPLTNEAKDKFIAPDMSAFTAATIEDLHGVSPEPDGWVASFWLNSIFRARFEGPLNTTLLNFLRRTHAAFQEYAVARTHTLAYLANPDAPRQYLAAMTHWEIFLSQAYQAHCLLDMGQKNMFTQGDGSVLERLSLLYGRAKHVEKAITTVGQLPENGTLPVWLTNDGLRSTDSHLTFSEIVDILRELARCAGAMEDPLTMREKLLAIAADSGEHAEAS